MGRDLLVAVGPCLPPHPVEGGCVEGGSVEGDGVSVEGDGVPMEGGGDEDGSEGGGEEDGDGDGDGDGECDAVKCGGCPAAAYAVLPPVQVFHQSAVL
jgi:hypothetical protein